MFFSRHTKPTEPSTRMRSVQSAPRESPYVYHSSHSQRTNESRPSASRLPADADTLFEERVHANASKWSNKRLWLVGVIVTALLVQGMRLATPVKVVTVEADGASSLFLRDQHAYVVAANELFGSLWNRNKITADTNGVATELRERYPELRAVSVSLPIVGTHPTVYIHPSRPALVLVTRNGVYLLNNEGRALMNGNQVPSLGKLGIPVVDDQSGVPVELGRIALPAATVAAIEEIAGQLKAKQISLTSMALVAGSTELHIKIAGAGYIIKFSTYGPARAEAGTYLATKRKLDAARIMPKEYIDVRVAGRAYYK